MLRLTVFVLFLVSVTGNTLDEYETIKLNEYLSDNLREYHLNKLPDYECTINNINLKDIKFYLYTRRQPDANQIEVSEHDHLKQLNYNVMKTTKFIIPSWLQDTDDYTDMIKDYLQMQNVNVILIDWSRYGRYCNYNSTHEFIVSTVAKELAKLMRHLIGYGSNSINFHEIGYGVGAHIAGMTAKFIAPYRVGRITALDPIEYGWNYFSDPKIQTWDAHFIDVIYSSSPLIGTKREFGHLLFYPNGGAHPQPGVSDSVVASSLKSLEYFMQSITRPTVFPSYKSESWEDFLDGKYNMDEMTQMGEYAYSGMRGKYYLKT